MSWLILVTGSLLVAPVAAQQVSEADNGLRVIDTALIDDTIALDLILPRADAGRELPPDAFSVNDVQPPPDVSWLQASLTVDLVVELPPSLDDPRAADWLSGVQAGLTGLTQRFPPNAAIRVITANDVVDTGVDRSRVRDALRELSTASGGSLAEAFAGAPAPDTQAHAVVVVAAEDPETIVGAFRESRDSAAAAAAQSTLWHLRPTEDGDGRLVLTRAVLRTGPPVVISDPPNLFAGLDRVAVEIGGSYRLIIPEVPEEAPLEVRVATPNGTSTATVAAPGPQLGAEPVEPVAPPDAGLPSSSEAASDDGGRGRLIPAVVLVAVLGAAISGAFLLWRARTRRQAGALEAPPGTQWGEPPDPSVAVSGAPAPATALASPAIVPAPGDWSSGAAPPTGPPVHIVDDESWRPAAIGAVGDQPLVGSPSPPSDWPGPVAPVGPSMTNEHQTGHPGSWSGPEPVGDQPAWTPPAVVAPPEIWRADTGVIDLTTAGPVAGSQEAARREAAGHVDGALALLATQRATSIQPIPMGLLVAIEAVESARFDRAVPADEISRLLASGGPDPTDATNRRAKATVVALSHPDMPAPQLARRLEVLMQPDDVERDDGPQVRFRAPTRTAESGSFSGQSVLYEVSALIEAGTVGATPTQGDSTGAVGRCLLATWAARHGRILGIPLIISPSLFTGPDEAAHGDSTDDQVVVILTALSDAIGRMADAEAAFDALHVSYRTKLRSLTPRTEVADRVASLLMRRPVLDLFVASTRWGRTPDGARRLLVELAHEGWLAHRGDIVVNPDAADEADPAGARRPTETWVAHEVVNTVIGRFTDARYPAPATSADVLSTT